MILICGQDDRIAAWTAARIPHMAGGDFGPCVAIGVAGDDGVLIAGVVYHNYRPWPGGGDMEMSIAATSPLWCRRGVLRALFQYPFVQAGCHRVTACTGAGNAAAIKLNSGLGFRPEGRMRKGFGTEDAIIMGLLREDARRWLGDRDDGQEGTETPAGTGPGEDGAGADRIQPGDGAGERADESAG